MQAIRDAQADHSRYVRQNMEQRLETGSTYQASKLALTSFSDMSLGIEAEPYVGPGLLKAEPVFSA